MSSVIESEENANQKHEFGLEIEGVMLNVFSALKLGKEEFWRRMDKVVECVPRRERVMDMDM